MASCAFGSRSPRSLTCSSWKCTALESRYPVFLTSGLRDGVSSPHVLSRRLHRLGRLLLLSMMAWIFHRSGRSLARPAVSESCTKKLRLLLPSHYREVRPLCCCSFLTSSLTRMIVQVTRSADVPLGTRLPGQTIQYTPAPSPRTSGLVQRRSDILC